MRPRSPSIPLLPISAPSALKPIVGCHLPVAGALVEESVLIELQEPLRHATTVAGAPMIGRSYLNHDAPIPVITMDRRAHLEHRATYATNATRPIRSTHADVKHLQAARPGRQAKPSPGPLTTSRTGSATVRAVGAPCSAYREGRRR